jgi:hypothetical protein
VERGELDHIIKMLFFVGISVIRTPSIANGELVEAQHIHDPMKIFAIERKPKT